MRKLPCDPKKPGRATLHFPEYLENYQRRLYIFAHVKASMSIKKFTPGLVTDLIYFVH